VVSEIDEFQRFPSKIAKSVTRDLEVPAHPIMPVITLHSGKLLDRAQPDIPVEISKCSLLAADAKRLVPAADQLHVLLRHR